jgi:hypothetical protein
MSLSVGLRTPNPTFQSSLERAVVVGFAVVLALDAASHLRVSDPRFRAAFAVVWVSMAVRRLWFRRAPASFGDGFQAAGVWPAVLLVTASIPWMLLPLLSDAGSQWFAPVVTAMPPWLRWVGAALGTASILAPFCAGRDRMKNLGWTEDGSAILSLFLLSANWLVGLLGIAGLSLAFRGRNPQKLVHAR